MAGGERSDARTVLESNQEGPSALQTHWCVLALFLQQLARTAKLLALFSSVSPLAHAVKKRVFLAVFFVVQHRNRIVKDKKTVTKELRRTTRIPLHEVVERLERRRLVDVDEAVE